MGFQANRRLIYIVACLLLAAGFIYLMPATGNYSPKSPLSEALTHFASWNSIGDTFIGQPIVESLNLDDYLFRNYSNDSRIVSLYIGYYRTTDKVGDAHSPLVCFPGQGWEISTPKNLLVETKSGSIHAKKLLIKKEQQRELILYWFQSYDMTASNTFMQKVQGLWARLNSKPGDNAFVRVSIATENDDVDAALKTARHFIQDFYPLFLTYITNNRNVHSIRENN